MYHTVYHTGLKVNIHLILMLGVDEADSDGPIYLHVVDGLYSFFFKLGYN